MEFACQQCGCELLYADQICPQCGSRFVALKDEFSIDDEQYSYKKKNKKIYKSKHRWYETAYLRREECHDLDGEEVLRYKKEDRLNNSYMEIVWRKNGEVIHYDEGLLTDHMGHGDAKRKKGGGK